MVLNGTLVASAHGNTIIYNRPNNVTIKLPTDGEYYNLVIAGTLIKTLEGDINILGDLSITSTLNTANYNIDLKGNWSNSNIFDEGTGVVILSGTGDQNISNPVGETFYDLRLDKPSGAMTMDNDVRVSNTLTMLQGNILTGSNTLVLGTGTGNPGSLSHTAGTLIGTMERWINATGTPSFILWVMLHGTGLQRSPLMI